MRVVSAVDAILQDEPMLCDCDGAHISDDCDGPTAA
jgi:hypothetical protein